MKSAVAHEIQRRMRVEWLKGTIAMNRSIVAMHERLSAEHGSDFASELSVRGLLTHRLEMERELEKLTADPVGWDEIYGQR